MQCVHTKLPLECGFVGATVAPLMGGPEPTAPAGDCGNDNLTSFWPGGCTSNLPSARVEPARGFVGSEGILDSSVVAQKSLCGGSTGCSSEGLSDSGGSGGQSSGGKHQKSGSESSNSSSQQSRSGGGGRNAGGSCSHSGSSDSSGDEDDEDKRRRPHHKVGGANKDVNAKLVDDDDEATDSADEGVEDTTPNSMIMDFSPPQSNKSEGDRSSKESQYAGPYLQQVSSQLGLGSHRPTSLTPISNHYEGKSAMHNSATISTPLDNQGATGTISVESMAESSRSVESSNAINMIVGYGVPASLQPRALDKTPPESELGTPTLDSPPPLLGEDKGMPLATPVPMTPMLSQALTLIPQVSSGVFGM